MCGTLVRILRLNRSGSYGRRLHTDWKNRKQASYPSVIRELFLHDVSIHDPANGK